MNIKTILVPITALLLLLFAGSSAAQQSDIAAGKLTVPVGEYSVGDPILLELEISHPEGSHVIIPELDSEWGNFIVYSQLPPESVSNEDGSKTTTQIIDVRLFAPGEFSSPNLLVTVATADGQLTELNIEAASVSIGSVLVEGDEELRDIKPQAELPYIQILPWVAAAAILVFITLLVFWLRRRRKLTASEEMVDFRLPHELALERLNRIEALDLPTEGKFKEHYTLVSDCVRIYVESAFDIAVMERTTAEIQASIRKTTIEPQVSRRFIALLDESDLVKFSKFRPDVASARQALLTGRQIVLETRPRVEHDSPGGAAGLHMDTPADASEPTVSANGSKRQTEVRA